MWGRPFRPAYGEGGVELCETVKVWPATVIVPLRADPSGDAAAVNVTPPLPVPDAPEVMAIQSGAFDAAVHVQFAALAVTLIDPPPPDIGTVCPFGAMLKLHAGGGGGGGGGGGAACESVNVWPPMVMVPLRAPPVFAAALKPTLPLPLPDAPEVTVIQSGALDVAVHAHAASVVTATDPVPPAGSTDADAGAIEYVHGAAAPA